MLTSKVLNSASLLKSRLSRHQSLARSYSSMNPMIKRESRESTIVYPIPPAEVRFDPDCERGWYWTGISIVLSFFCLRWGCLSLRQHRKHAFHKHSSYPEWSSKISSNNLQLDSRKINRHTLNASRTAFRLTKSAFSSRTPFPCLTGPSPCLIVPNLAPGNCTEEGDWEVVVEKKVVAA